MVNCVVEIFVDVFCFFFLGKQESTTKIHHKIHAKLHDGSQGRGVILTICGATKGYSRHVHFDYQFHDVPLLSAYSSEKVVGVSFKKTMNGKGLGQCRPKVRSRFAFASA